MHGRRIAILRIPWYGHTPRGRHTSLSSAMGAGRYGRGGGKRKSAAETANVVQRNHKFVTAARAECFLTPWREARPSSRSEGDYPPAGVCPQAAPPDHPRLPRSRLSTHTTGTVRTRARPRACVTVASQPQPQRQARPYNGNAVRPCASGSEDLPPSCRLSPSARRGACCWNAAHATDPPNMRPASMSVQWCQ
jgi:hypothetical protein